MASAIIHTFSTGAIHAQNTPPPLVKTIKRFQPVAFRALFISDFRVQLRRLKQKGVVLSNTILTIQRFKAARSWQRGNLVVFPREVTVAAFCFASLKPFLWFPAYLPVRR
jgi:hypothetical protein